MAQCAACENEVQTFSYIRIKSLVDDGAVFVELRHTPEEIAAAAIGLKAPLSLLWHEPTMLARLRSGLEEGMLHKINVAEAGAIPRALAKGCGPRQRRTDCDAIRWPVGASS